MTGIDVENPLKTAWAEGGAALGLWIAQSSTATAEALVGVDVDYINIDMQHGMNDYRDTVEILRALRLSSSALTVRVPWNEPGIIGKVLDAGALGVIIPMVNSVAEAEAAVSACRYAPEGGRSYGPVRAGLVHGSGYFPSANRAVACIPMIETGRAVADLDAILQVPGIDAIYVGPADLSVSLGLPPGNNDGEAAFDDALSTIVAACKKHDIVAGIHATPQLTQRRIDQGFRMVTVTSDLLALGAGVRSSLEAARTGGHSGDDAMY